MNLILTELYSEDKTRKAIVSLEDEMLVIDYYQDDKYTSSEVLPHLTFTEAKDKAEDYVLYQEHR